MRRARRERNFAMTHLFFMQSSEDPLAIFKNPGSTAGEVLLLVGAIVVIALVFFGWAAYMRSPRKKHHSYHHDHGGLPERRRRRSGISRLFGRKHRRRKSHSRERPVNPTLSQVGGLPTKREEQRPPS